VPRSVGYLQAGLYYDGETVRSDRPKPLLQAFRFPVVAFPRGKEIYVWGRTAAGIPGRVVVQRLVNRRWKTLGQVQTDRYGIFQATFTAPARGSVRALYGGSTSRPFSLKAVPDHVYNPFGADQTAAGAGR
jgi:hypothetical protein